MVNLTLRVLSRPDTAKLPVIVQNLGLEYDEKVLPSIGNEVLHLCLDDPADLARVSCVSRSWRDFVVSNGLSKQLCLRMFPQLSRVACVVELNQDGVKEHSEVGSSQSNECLALWKDHRVYSYLARSCLSPVAMDCIDKAISASSTDNFPQESIVNTLEERDNIAGRFSYWSSSGQNNPNVPETLTYQLASQICVITEINIQPFQAHFQMGSPIYSAKSVRFKMGHIKASLDDLTDAFVWTYTSPEFPMAQDFAYLYDPNNETAGAFVPAQILYDAFHGRYHNSAGAIGWMKLLSQMALKLPDVSNLKSLTVLCNEDGEANFFDNIADPVFITEKVFMRLFFNMLFDEKEGQETLVHLM
ncbi:hypothetical protein RYX36_020392 [Vicia faba]